MMGVGMTERYQLGGKMRSYTVKYESRMKSLKVEVLVMDVYRD